LIACIVTAICFIEEQAVCFGHCLPILQCSIELTHGEALVDFKCCPLTSEKIKLDVDMPLCLVTYQSVLVTTVAIGSVIYLRHQFSLKTFDWTSCSVVSAAWGRPCNIYRSTALLLLVVYLWLMAHYKTLFDSKSYVNDFSILDGGESYWKL